MKQATFKKVPRPINGIDGKDGLDGINGENGLDGKDGMNGKDGANGLDGRDGLPGVNGRNGIDGKPGEDGERGLQGAQGDTGLQGEAGPQGIPGEKGEKGDKGDTGPTPDHQIDRKKGRIRFKRDDGTWGAWVEIKAEVIDRTVTNVMDSGGRGEQAAKAIADLATIQRTDRIRTVTSDDTFTADDYTIVADASSNTVTVLLPDAPGKGIIYNLACLNSTNAVEMDFNGKNFYDSSDNEAMFKGENLKVQYDGTQWVSA
jgi:hypothetical protein